MNRDSQFILALGWIALFLFLHASANTWLEWNVFGSILTTTAIMYIVYQRWIYTNYSVMEQLNNQLIQINIDKYPNLQTDLNVVRILLDLKPIMKMDRIKYTELLESIDHFFQYYKQINHIQYDKHQLYEASVHQSKRALNILSNFILNSPVYPQLSSDRTLTTDYTLIVPSIEKYSDILKKLFSKYLDQMEMVINRDWKRGNINYISKPVLSGQPDAYNESDDPYLLY